VCNLWLQHCYRCRLLLLLLRRRRLRLARALVVVAVEVEVAVAVVLVVVPATIVVVVLVVAHQLLCLLANRCELTEFDTYTLLYHPLLRAAYSYIYCVQFGFTLVF